MIKLNRKYYPEDELIKLKIGYKSEDQYFIIEENIMNFKAINHILTKLLNEQKI